MTLDSETGIITWRIHLASSPERVYTAITTDEGRARFWAESTTETHNSVRFAFPNGLTWNGQILSARPFEYFELDYFGNRVSFSLQEDGQGGTDLTLQDRGTTGADQTETAAGWISVLLTLKAYVDHGSDLRNHDSSRTWDQDYVDN
jgi:uncharacterized protein YndB with AHSA1/START domain